MPDLLYGRRAVVRIAIPVATPGDYLHTTTDVIEISGGDDPAAPGHRIKFEINKTSEKEPNTSQIIITNLSSSTRARLQPKGLKLTFDAGYAAVGVARIYSGDTRSTDFIRSDADWDTLIKVGDGERSYRFARLNQSFAPNTSAASVLQALVNASGLAAGNLLTASANIKTVFDQGYVVKGLVSRSIDRLVKSLGYRWSIQNDTMQFLQPGQTLDGDEPEISPQTGLVGSPEMGSPEKKTKTSLVKFKALLFATRPGARVKLISDRYNGFVRVKKCKMYGDTHGGDWYTEVEGVLLAS